MAACMGRRRLVVRGAQAATGVDARRGARAARRHRRGARDDERARALPQRARTSSSTTSTTPASGHAPMTRAGGEPSRGAARQRRHEAVDEQPVDGPRARRAVAEPEDGARSRSAVHRVGVAPPVRASRACPGRRTTRRGSRRRRGRRWRRASTRWHSPVAQVAASTAHSARTSRGAPASQVPSAPRRASPRCGAIAELASISSRAALEHVARRPARARRRSAAVPSGRRAARALQRNGDGEPRRAVLGDEGVESRRDAGARARREPRDEDARRGVRRVPRGVVGAACRAARRARAGTSACERLDRAHAHLRRRDDVEHDLDGRRRAAPASTSRTSEAAVGGRERRDAQRWLAARAASRAARGR